MTTRTSAERKLQIWAETLKACGESSLGRSDDSYAQQKFEENLHFVMHRGSEVNYDSF